MTAPKYPFDAIPNVGDVEIFAPEGDDPKKAADRVAKAAWHYCRVHGGKISVKTLGKQICIARIA